MRRQKVLIHVDQRIRDAVPMLCLKQCLAERGVSVRLCNRVTINKAFYAFLPDVFVQSHIFFDKIGELKRKARIAKQVALPTEGAVFNVDAIDEHFQQLPEHNEVFSKIFVWGAYVKNRLLEKNIFDEDRVSVVGCPRYDVYRNYVYEPRPGRQVGFISQLGGLQPFDGRPMLRMIDVYRRIRGTCYDKDRRVEDFFWGYIAQCRVCYDIFDKWLTEKKQECVYRPHPNENRMVYEYMVKKYGGRFQLDKGDYFYVWLKSLAGLVMFASTTSVEALLSKTPFISLEKIIGDRYDDHQNQIDIRLPYVRCAWEPDTVEEAVDLMDRMTRGKLTAKEIPEDMKRVLYEMYDWPRKQSSIEQMADEIMSLIKSNHAKTDGKRSAKPWTSSIVNRFKLAGTYVWRLIGYVISKVNYEFDIYNHYFPWNIRDQRDAKRIYRDELIPLLSNRPSIE